MLSGASTEKAGEERVISEVDVDKRRGTEELVYQRRYSDDGPETGLYDQEVDDKLSRTRER